MIKINISEIISEINLLIIIYVLIIIFKINILNFSIKIELDSFNNFFI